jgi:methylthioxylose transferase
MAGVREGIAPSVARALPWAAAAVAAGTVAVGLYVRRATDTPLGVPYPPALGTWRPEADPLLVVTLACFTAAVLLAPRLLTLPPGAFAAAALGLTLLLRLALAAGGGGTGRWSAVFDPERSFEAKHEYLAALGALDYGPGFFLDRFAELVPALPVHAAGHPPGLLLVMDTFGISTPGRLAALCIAGGALVAPLAYAVGRQVLDERQARLAGLLTATAPSVLLFGATSADALYASLGLLAAWPLASSRPAHRGAGAVVLALASLFAWSLLAIAAWAALLAWRRRGVKDALGLGVLCAGALLVVQGALAGLSGFDPIGTLRATEQVYRFGIAGERPYWFWLAGSPTAFLLLLGLPVAWLALRALVRADDAAIAILGVIAVAAVAGFTKAEVERIWLCFAPLVCIAAAAGLQERHVRPVLAVLGAQALVWEVLWNTVW